MVRLELSRRLIAFGSVSFVSSSSSTAAGPSRGAPEAGRREVEHRAAADPLDAELVVVVHGAHVVRLAVVVLVTAVAEVQGVAELVEEGATVVVELHEVVAPDLTLAPGCLGAVGIGAVGHPVASVVEAVEARVRCGGAVFQAVMATDRVSEEEAAEAGEVRALQRVEGAVEPGQQAGGDVVAATEVVADPALGVEGVLDAVAVVVEAVGAGRSGDHAALEDDVDERLAQATAGIARIENAVHVPVGAGRVDAAVAVVVEVVEALADLLDTCFVHAGVDDRDRCRSRG